jgi:hypothetical protein
LLDFWMFCIWTPSFLVIPGTEGMPGYKDWRMHVKAHMTSGAACRGGGARAGAGASLLEGG